MLHIINPGIGSIIHIVRPKSSPTLSVVRPVSNVPPTTTATEYRPQQRGAEHVQMRHETSYLELARQIRQMDRRGKRLNQYI